MGKKFLELDERFGFIERASAFSAGIISSVTFSAIDYNFFSAQNISLRDNLIGMSIVVCSGGLASRAVKNIPKPYYRNFSLGFCAVGYLAGRILYEMSR